MKKTLQLILPVIIILMMAFQAMALISGPLSVASTATLVASKDGDRVWWTICNTGTNTVYLKYDDSTNVVTSTNGAILAPGGTVSYYGSAGASLAQNAVWAITSTNTSTLSFQSSGQR